MIEVQSWGVAGSIRDAGRPGRAWLGAPRGGAVDPVALALANRLVGNPEDRAAFETSGGLSVRTDAPVMVAVAGAVAVVAVDGGPPVGWGSPVVLPAGAVLRVVRLLDGARAYVSVRGGVRAAGRLVEVGDDPGTPAATHTAAPLERVTTLRCWPGPRRDWFTASAWQRLLEGPFTVTSTSRVGARLHGPTLGRLVEGELASEGLVEGAIQVPPDGDPIVMLADHPTTGGYPVIAVVDPADVRHAAQAAVGTSLRFRPA